MKQSFKEFSRVGWTHGSEFWRELCEACPQTPNGESLHTLGPWTGALLWIGSKEQHFTLEDDEGFALLCVDDDPYHSRSIQGRTVQGLRCAEEARLQKRSFDLRPWLMYGASARIDVVSADVTQAHSQKFQQEDRCFGPGS